MILVRMKEEMYEDSSSDDDEDGLVDTSTVVEEVIYLPICTYIHKYVPSLSWITVNGKRFTGVLFPTVSDGRAVLSCFQSKSGVPTLRRMAVRHRVSRILSEEYTRIPR